MKQVFNKATLCKNIKDSVMLQSIAFLNKDIYI